MITDIGPQAPTPSGRSRPHRASVKVVEDATWVGTRDKTHSYGFASFDVEPNAPRGKTQIHMKIWDTAPSPTGMPTVFEEFTMERPARDSERERSGAEGGTRLAARLGHRAASHR